MLLINNLLKLILFLINYIIYYCHVDKIYKLYNTTCIFNQEYVFTQNIVIYLFTPILKYVNMEKKKSICVSLDTVYRHILILYLIHRSP